MKTFTKYLLGLALFTTTAVKPVSLPNIKNITFKGHVLPAAMAAYGYGDILWNGYKNLASTKQQAADVAKTLGSSIAGKLEDEAKNEHSAFVKRLIFDLGVIFVAYCLHSK